MVGPVYGLLAVIAVLLLTKRMGLRRPRGDHFLIGGAVCFGAALLFQTAAVKPADAEVLQFAALFAMGGWGLVLFTVFDAVKADDPPADE